MCVRLFCMLLILGRILVAHCFDAPESILKRHLFSNYNPTVRPTLLNDTVVVQVGMAMRQMIDMNERNQILFSGLWYRWRWNDMFLKWNPADFDNITVFRTKPSNIWRPDIILYNDVREEERSTESYEVFVYNTGLVVWNFPMFLRSACKVDVTYYPFDRQICPLKFGSWAYDGFLLDITNQSTGGDLSTFLKNGEFILEDIPVRRHVLFYGCCPEPYPDVTFYIVLQRKSMFTLYNLVLPCIVLTFITLMGFYLPPDSGEKISLQVTSLLALFVFLLLVAEQMPPQSDVVPLIGQFFLANMMLMTVSIGANVCILNMFFRGQHGTDMPEWLKKVLFSFLAKVLCMSHLVENLEEEEEELKKCHEERQRFSLAAVVEMVQHKRQQDQEHPGPSNAASPSSLPANKRFLQSSWIPPPAPPHLYSSGLTLAQKTKDVKDLKDIVSRIEAKIDVFEKLQLEREKCSLSEAHYRLGAIVLDRLHLLLLLIANVLVSIVFLVVFPVIADMPLTDEMLENAK